MMSGRTSESLYDNVIRDLIRLGRGDIKYGKQPQRCYVSSRNIEIACASADNERSWGRIQGKTVYGWLADEIVQHPKSFVTMAQSRCRGGGKPSPKFWTCNPDSPSHFIKKQYMENEEIDKMNWYFTFDDNPLLTKEYINELKNSYTGIYYDRFIMGKWVIAEGIVYDRFNRAIHVIKDYPQNEVKEYVLGIDWGYAKDHPLAIGLIAITDRAYYVIDEIYVEKTLIDESLVKMMKDKGWYKLRLRRVDPEASFIVKDVETKPSYAYCDSSRPDLMDTFYKLSGINVVPAIKDVDDGIQAVHRKFNKSGDGSYGLYFLDKCHNHIREFELYRWLESLSGEGKNVPKPKDDHCPDEVRYVIYTRERGKVRVLKDPRRN